MRAAFLDSLPSNHLRVGLASDPEASSGEALVEVEACGICGTDLHILAGHSYRPELPFILGHEPVGRLLATTAEGSLREGQRVTMTIFEGCGRCAFCNRGDERLCPNLKSIVGVYKRSGGFAEQLTVPARQLIPVPDEITPSAGASLVDAGATAANTVRKVIDARPDRVVVLGAGPVGLLVAELLRHEGIRPTIVEPNELRRADIAQRGYPALPSLNDYEGPQLDCVIDCAAISAGMNQALDRLEPNGVFVVVGYARSEVDFSLIARKELRVIGVRSGARGDLERVLELVANGQVIPPRVTSFALGDVNDALQALRNGELAGKAVIAVSPV